MKFTQIMLQINDLGNYFIVESSTRTWTTFSWDVEKYSKFPPSWKNSKWVYLRKAFGFCKGKPLWMHFFFKAYSPFLVSFKSFENFQLTCLQSAFLLCNSATSADRFHLKLLQLIQTNVQRAFFKRWSLVRQLNFFCNQLSEE